MTDKKVKRMVEQEVIVNVSTLVDTLQQNTKLAESFNESLENEYPLKDDSQLIYEFGDEYREDWQDCVKDDPVDEQMSLADYIRSEESDIYDYDSEIFEWWLVTPWLYYRLKEREETVADWCNLRFWGRRTTGQTITLDEVMQQIQRETKYADYLDKEEKTETAADGQSSNPHVSATDTGVSHDDTPAAGAGSTGILG